MSDITRKSGTQNELEGKAKELGGRMKDALGDLTGNPRHDVEGKMDKLEGKAQQELGHAQKDVEDVEAKRRRDAL